MRNVVSGAALPIFKSYLVTALELSGMPSKKQKFLVVRGIPPLKTVFNPV